jgi:plasmid maintenance system antidote protein VapI
MDFPTKDQDVREQIYDYIKNRGIAVAFVARHLHCSTHHLTEILKCRRVLTSENLKLINEKFETDFKAHESPASPMKATG